MCVVTCLAQFLEQHCNIDVSLDIRDIPHTENKVRIVLCFTYYFVSQFKCWALTENFAIEDRLPRDVELRDMLGTSVDSFESSPGFLGTVINNIIFINTVQLKICTCNILSYLSQKFPLNNYKFYTCFDLRSPSFCLNFL
jgi:hypothetical protein